MDKPRDNTSSCLSAQAARYLLPTYLAVDYAVEATPRSDPRTTTNADAWHCKAMERCHGAEAAEKHLGAAGRRYTRSWWHRRLGAKCGHDEHHLGHPFTIHGQLLVPLDDDMDEGQAV